MRVELLGVGSVYVFAITILSVPVVFSQPTWEVYESKNCGISFVHPYSTDIITANSPETLHVVSTKDQTDADSLSMNVTITCIKEKIPITEETMNITMAGLREDLSLVTFEENSFNETIIDSELASTVSVGGPVGILGESQARTVTELNHNNKTFVIKFNSLGQDGINGFFENHNYLKDNVLNSIKFHD